MTIRVSDRSASELFYNTVLPTVGLKEPRRAEPYTEWGDFSLAQSTVKQPVTRRLHIAFFAPSRAVVDEFWRAGTEAGYPDDGAPGPRAQYSEDYYGAFLLDPDGNSAEAVHHGRTREPGRIDHLWIRVADVSASRRFYETIAPHAGLHVSNVLPERVHFAGASSSFGLVAGEPTEQLHVAFPAEDDETVRTFHRAATEAGYRGNGAPGEREIYHPGYYGAFVLDPDGNNVEAVFHDR